jgi:L-amino acid N-acyltransferase YncA
MGVLLRPFRDTDADRLLEIANAALSGAAAENEKWARNRLAFDATTWRRRQYVAEEDGAKPVAYAALEEGPERGRFRAFVVCPSERLDPTGDALFDRLLGDARDLGATSLWVRELTRDPVLNLFRARGMRQVSRFELMGVGEVVVLEMSLSEVH